MEQQFLNWVQDTCAVCTLKNEECKFLNYEATANNIILSSTWSVKRIYLLLSCSVQEPHVSKTKTVKCYTHNEIPTGNVLAKGRTFGAVKEMKDVGKYCFSELLSRHVTSDCFQNESRCLPRPAIAQAHPGNFKIPDLPNWPFAQTYLHLLIVQFSFNL